MLGRSKLPPTLDRLRTALDEAAVRRVFLPHTRPPQSAAEVATDLSVTPGSVVDTLLADADGDRLIVLVPSDRRLDLRLLATAVGARRVRLSGAGDVPRDKRGTSAAEPPVRYWGESATVTTLPTVIERLLITREFLYAATGDPLWTLKIGPTELRKVTNAIVADIVRPSR